MKGQYLPVNRNRPSPINMKMRSCTLPKWVILGFRLWLQSPVALPALLDGLLTEVNSFNLFTFLCAHPTKSSRNSPELVCD